MTQRHLELYLTIKLFQCISLPYFPLHYCKDDVNINSTLRNSQTALDPHASGTDLGACSASHNYGRKEVKIHREVFKSHFKHVLYISINAFMILEVYFVRINVKCYQQTAAAGCFKGPSHQMGPFGLILTDGTCFIAQNKS